MKTIGHVILGFGLVLASPIMLQAKDYTWTGNGANNNWTNTSNWQSLPTGGYPSTLGDTATFKSTGTDFAVVDMDVTVGSVEVQAKKFVVQDNGASVTTLTIGDRDGLTIQSAASPIEIQQDGKLVLKGGGTLTLDNNITFTGGSGINDGVLHIEKATVIPASGSGDIVGAVNGVISAASKEAVLILGAGHDMTGTLEIQAPLVNNGRIIADADGETITLSTYAKTGTGQYEVSGHATAKIIVNIPVSASAPSSGDQLTISAGTFDVNEFCVMCGELNMTGGTIDIEVDAMFEISGCD